MTAATDMPLGVRAARTLIRRLPAGRYRAMNASVSLLRFLGQGREPFWASAASGSDRFEFLCNLREAITREVCYMGLYEPQETALLRNLLEPGMAFVDVGANWGYYTLLASARVGPRGRVVGFEPDPRLFALLRANVERNRWDHVSVLSVAAAANHGTMLLAGFDEREDKWGLSRIVAAADPGGVSFQVRTGPVDDLLDECGVGVVDLLKMDIEGAEDLALQGMRAGLARHRYRRLLVEVHPTILSGRGVTVRGALRPLAESGYRGWWIDHSAAGNRKAYYGRRLDIRQFLTPFDASDSSDPWPHTFWLAPGMEL